MGWTHNWQRRAELPAEKFKAAVDDVKAIVQCTGVAVAGADGTGRPIFDEERMVFNGLRGQHCEPFEIARIQFDRHGRDPIWSFCKTEHMPYDICVQAALIVMAHHLDDLITVGSDGSEGDWEGARNLLQEHLGYGNGFQLTSGG